MERETDLALNTSASLQTTSGAAANNNNNNNNKCVYRRGLDL
jgi:hypothetical protein